MCDIWKAKMFSVIFCLLKMMVSISSGVLHYFQVSYILPISPFIYFPWTTKFWKTLCSLAEFSKFGVLATATDSEACRVKYGTAPWPLSGRIVCRGALLITMVRPKINHPLLPVNLLADPLFNHQKSILQQWLKHSASELVHLHICRFAKK